MGVGLRVQGYRCRISSRGVLLLPSRIVPISTADIFVPKSVKERYNITSNRGRASQEMEDEN
jgi:hypothetical protein